MDRGGGIALATARLTHVALDARRDKVADSISKELKSISPHSRGAIRPRFCANFPQSRGVGNADRPPHRQPRVQMVS